MKENKAVAIPVPKSESSDKSLVQGYINKQVYDAVESERKKKKIKKNQVIEYGYKSFLTAVNPAKAIELGII